MSKSNKKTKKSRAKNTSKKNPPKAAIARIKAQRLADQERLLEEKRLDEEIRLEEEKRLEIETQLERERVEKAAIRTAKRKEAVVRQKESQKQRDLEEKLRKYN